MNPILYESKRIIIDSGDMRIVALKASSLFSGGARQGARVEGGVSPVKHHPLHRPGVVST